VLAAPTGPGQDRIKTHPNKAVSGNAESRNQLNDQHQDARRPGPRQPSHADQQSSINPNSQSQTSHLKRRAQRDRRISRAWGVAAQTLRWVRYR